MLNAVWRGLRATLKGLDQAAGLVIFGRPRTISAIAAEARPARWACVLCRLLDLFERDHCDKALSSE